MNSLSDAVRSLVSQDFSQLSLDFAGHYLLIDIGANLTNRKFAKDLDQVLQRAREMGKFGLSVQTTTDFIRSLFQECAKS